MFFYEYISTFRKRSRTTCQPRSLPALPVLSTYTMQLTDVVSTTPAIANYHSIRDGAILLVAYCITYFPYHWFPSSSSSSSLPARTRLLPTRRGQERTRSCDGGAPFTVPSATISVLALHTVRSSSPVLSAHCLYGESSLQLTFFHDQCSSLRK
jgi:hypothetical protein